MPKSLKMKSSFKAKVKEMMAKFRFKFLSNAGRDIWVLDNEECTQTTTSDSDPLEKSPQGQMQYSFWVTPK